MGSMAEYEGTGRIIGINKEMEEKWEYAVLSH